MAKFILKRFFLIVFSIPLLFTSNTARATHMMGADITYRCIDTLKFEITLKWYRDCRGISLNRGGNLTTVPLLNKQTIAAVSWDKEVEELEIEMEDGSKLNIAEVGRIEN